MEQNTDMILVIIMYYRICRYSRGLYIIRGGTNLLIIVYPLLFLKKGLELRLLSASIFTVGERTIHINSASSDLDPAANSNYYLYSRIRLPFFDFYSTILRVWKSKKDSLL